MSRYRFSDALPTAATKPVAAINPAAAALYPSALETRFPRILEAIQALWGYPELNAYFDKLAIDDRGDREGFPPDAWDEISLLMHIHQRLVPTSRP